MYFKTKTHAQKALCIVLNASTFLIPQALSFVQKGRDETIGLEIN